MSQAVQTLSENQIAEAMKKIHNGATFADALGVSKEALEGGYALAYRNFVAGNYKDAQILFQTIALYNPLDKRFMLGLGLCREMLEDFSGAIDAFMASAMLSDLQDPIPLFHASTCLIKLGKKEEAILGLELILNIEENEYNKALRERSKTLISNLK